MTLSGAAAIAGIGATEFSKESGRSELQLSAEATLHALADAGLTPADVDGLVASGRLQVLASPPAAGPSQVGPAPDGTSPVQVA